MRKKFDSKWTPMNVVAMVVMLIFSLIIIFPLVWAFISSFKHRLDWTWNKIGFPSNEYSFEPRAWQWENYSIALSRLFVPTEKGNVYMYQQAFNSIFYAATFTAASIFMHCLIAYIVAKYNFKFGKVVYSIVLVTMMLPIVGSMSSGLQVRQALGIYGKYWGELAITFGGFGGMHFLIFYACFKAIPWSYAEAAQMDGAGHFKIFIRIMVPLAWSTITGVLILNFIAAWNNYQTPLVYLPNMPTLAVGLFMFKSKADELSSEPRRLAATMMVATPTLLLFVIFRNKIMGNIAIGGLKG